MASDPEPGAAQEAVHHQHWISHVRRKHRLRTFKPPFADCKCRSWQTSAPEDLGVVRQRDYLLDAFNDHLKAMRAEKKRLRELRPR